MIKMLAFDLDGVLVSTKDLHFNALNLALETIDPNLKISYEDHIKFFDGLPTKIKLSKLNIDQKLHPTIEKIKQRKTFDFIKSHIHNDKNLINIFLNLKKMGFIISVVSNSIRKTIEIILEQIGILDLVDIIISNEDVKNNKPHNEPYLMAMLKAGCSSKETIIFEDSLVGTTSAFNSGAYVYIVKTPSEITLENIIEYIKKIPNNGNIIIHNLNILIPMAGMGSRFKKEGFNNPKPLIDVCINGKQKPMIQTVMENIGIIGAHYIFIVLKEHYDMYNLETILKILSPGCSIIVSNKITEGAASTALLAKELINLDTPLLIANSDQYIEWNRFKTLFEIISNDYDAAILTFIDKYKNSKWSFVKIDDDEFITEVAEKNPISDMATVGIYYFKHGKDFVLSAEKMIEKNIRTNNEFYICPVYNQFIQELNKKPKAINIDEMWGLGTPEDLEFFHRNKK